ncbi:hypothetical protein CGRAC_1775 [Campylobacter gracilis]|nr:hypothetical protein CGRAC_1775 [Campylobacter gracilis]
MNRSENVVRFFCRALAAVISRMRRDAKHILNKIKNARNGRDLLQFKPEVIKYERFKLKDIFWIKCGLRNLKSF